MPTKTIAKRYQELKEMLKEIQQPMTDMLRSGDPETVSIEELRIAFQMMYSVCIPFIINYSEMFQKLLKVASSFISPNPETRDFLAPH